MATYDENDLDWTWDGDLIIGDNGDIGDTSYDGLESLLNEIQTVVRSDFGDWEKHPIHASNLSDFRGEPNNRATAQAIEDRIKSSLTTAGIVAESDLTIRVVPVHSNQVLIILNIRAAATPNNSLTPGDNLVVSFTYDSLEDSVFFLPPSETAKRYLRS